MSRFTMFFVVTFSLAVLALTVSAYGTYEQTQPEQTYNPPTEPEHTYSPPMESPSNTNPTCRKLTELCIPYGDYSCCKGFSCSGWTEDLPGGVGICTPSNEPPREPKDKCQKSHRLCQPYGPYKCCQGLTCIHPRTLPPAAGLKPEQMKLPPGVGICESIN